MGHKGKRVIKIDANVSCLGDLENGSIVNQKFSYGHGNQRLLVDLQDIIYKKKEEYFYLQFRRVLVLGQRGKG